MEKSLQKVEIDVENYLDTPSKSSPTDFRSESRHSPGRRVNERKLIWKIDLSILPILFFAYFLQFLDKVVYNVSLLLQCQTMSNQSSAVCQRNGDSKGSENETERL